MKKVFKILLLIILVAPLLTGCREEKKVYKTEFRIHEVATIDHYEIVYKGYTATKNEMRIKFEIKNKNKITQLISLTEDFVIYSNESGKINNPYEEEIIAVKPGEPQEIQVVVTAEELFDKKGQLIDEIDTYKILFYSNVATNNIAFLF